MSVSKLSTHDKLVNFLVRLSDRYPNYVVVDNPIDCKIEVRESEMGNTIYSWTYEHILKELS